MQEPLNERLMHVYKELKKTGLITSKTAFMESIGQLKQHFAGFEGGARKVHPKHITLLVNQFGVNPDYMLSGKPPILRQGARQGGQTATAGRDIGIQAGRDVSQSGSNEGLERELEKARMEIEHLRARLEDKERLIELLLKR
jgi:hypothetical protein